MVYVRRLWLLASMALVSSKKMATGNSASSKLIRTGFSKIMPKGENQQLYVDYLKNKDVSIIAGIGPAGCGKTLFACHSAVSSLISGDYDKIVITRPLVSADEDLGFLPGTISQKMDPWVRPIFDALSEFYSVSQVKDMMQTGVIEISPLSYMRGRTFKRSFIIADEMQNSTPNQMLMMLTRIGDGSKLVITGDLMQSDLKRDTTNGLEDFVKKMKLYSEVDKTFVDGNIRMVEMGSTDVLRSEAVAKILDIYNENYSKKREQIPVLHQSSFNAPPSGAEMNGSAQVVRLLSESSTQKDVNMKDFEKCNEGRNNDDAALIPKTQYTISMKYWIDENKF